MASTSAIQGNNTITWYGERGIVNAAVAHIVRQNAAVQFMRCIQWANGLSPYWINEIGSVSFIMELGLAEFGNPDLILVCKARSDSRPFCVFIEAKVIPYSASAISNAEGMRQRGYNSACNGQLTLKYRFARALEKWDGRQDQIVEPAAIHQAYQHLPSDGGLGDPQPGPRKLQKVQILQKILAPLGLGGLPLDHFCFVALTWDRDPFYRSLPESLPRFYDESGVDIFQSLSEQIGWLGYQHLGAVSGLVEAITPALGLMVDRLMPTELDVMAAKWPRLVSQSVSHMSRDLQELMRDLEQLSIRVFGRDAIQFHTGSISIKSPSRVEAKIVPQEHESNGFVLLGIRPVPEWPIEVWSGLEPHGYRVMDQPFKFVQLPPGRADALMIAESVMKQLSEVLTGDHGLETCPTSRQG